MRGMGSGQGRSCSGKELFSCRGASQSGFWRPSGRTWEGVLYSSKLLSFPNSSSWSFYTSYTAAETFFFFWQPFRGQSVLWWLSWPQPKHKFLSQYLFRSWGLNFLRCCCLNVTMSISIGLESFGIRSCKVWPPQGCWVLRSSCCSCCLLSNQTAMFMSLLRESGCP